MQLQKKVLENMLENSLPIPNSYPDASNISLDGSGSSCILGMVQNKHGIVVKKKPQVKKTFNVGNV
jgi:hypothetical protein